MNYIERVDHMIEEAFNSNIKNSLKKLSRAINGDSKTTPSPLFKVLVTLHSAAPQMAPKVLDACFNPVQSLILIC